MSDALSRRGVRLTRSQQALLVRLADGENQRDAAAAANLSLSNARYHLARLMRLTRSANVTALVALAVSSGVLVFAGDTYRGTEVLDLLATRLGQGEE